MLSYDVKDRLDRLDKRLSTIERHLERALDLYEASLPYRVVERADAARAERDERYAAAARARGRFG